MKAVIVYFSITGNTKKIAEAIGGEFEREGVNTRLVSIRDYDNVNDSKEILEADVIGIGSPTHFSSLPYNIIPFILENLPDISGKPVFIFSTSGFSPFAALKSLSNLAREKGAEVVGALGAPGYDVIPQIKPLGINVGKPDSGDLHDAERFAHYLIFKLENKPKARAWDISEKIKVSRRWEYVQGVLFAFFRKRTYSPPMHISEKCISLGLCAKACPVHRIKMHPKPAFIGECLMCYQCVYACPREAIKINYPLIPGFVWSCMRWLVQKSRKAEHEYHNPYFYL